MEPRALVEATVVVCTRDRPAFALDAVRSILAATPAPREIVVVDQSSDSSRLAEAVSSLERVRHLPSETRGLSTARNLGARAASTEVIAYCDDDELATDGWVAALVRALDGEQVVATGRVLAGDREAEDGFVPATVLDERATVHRGRLRRDVLAGGNMAIRRSDLGAVGGWDERLGAGSRYPAAEDNDLGFRLLEAGYAIAYVPEAALVHRAWRVGRRYPVVRWRYGLGKGGFYTKHAGLDGRPCERRALRDVARRLARAPVVVWRRPRYALGELAYALGVIVGTARWAAEHRRGRL